MTPDPATFYFTQGVLGVTVIVLGLVIRVLWNEVKKERTEKAIIQKEKEVILEAWRVETKTDGQTAIDVLKGNSQSILYLADKIQTGKAEGKAQ